MELPSLYVPSFVGLLFNQSLPNQIEDMFYNTPTRLSALRSPSEEYARILDVVTKYAVHNSKVAFFCKKVCKVDGVFTFLLTTLTRLDLRLQNSPLRPHPSTKQSAYCMVTP